jgi:hypothetical protein
VPTIAEIKKKKEDLARLLREADRVTNGPRDELESQRQLMNRKRSEARDIDYTPCYAKKRRDILEADTPRWLRAFFPVRLSHPFTDQQREWIEQIEARMVSGGDKAIAAPRGEGKTTIAELVLLKAILTGKIRYAVLVAATGTHAKRSLRNIKRAIEKSSRLGRYYPEVCFPVQEMDRAPQKAKKQTCNGVYTDMRWETEAITLPTMPGSRCSGSMISCHGLDTAIRGINEEGLRPDFILIDDPETRESARSPLQIEAREEIIERDLAGLGGPGEICGRLMLCTIQNPTCLSATYTSEVKPWDGKRYKLLAELPTNQELWTHYVELQKKSPTEATEYYVANREAMDAGAVASNPYRFVDGVELSPIQHFYNWVARIGWDAVLAEYQNDPTEESGPQESGINPLLVSSRTNAFPQREIPPGCTALVAFIDIGKSWSHWTVQAWQPSGVGFVVDYDVIETFKLGTAASEATVEWAIVQGLRQWRDETAKNPYRCAGEPVKLDRVLIDSGDYTDAVYSFCKEAGPPFYPSKGFGNFYPGVTNQAKGHYASAHWYTQIQPNGVKLVGLDSVHWKRWAHERFLTNTYDDKQNFLPGSISLFSPGDIKNRHHSFAHHICAEIWTETESEKGLKRGFKVKDGRNNHWLDATAGACAAADMCGIRIVGEGPKQKPKYVALGDYANRARRAS